MTLGRFASPCLPYLPLPPLVKLGTILEICTRGGFSTVELPHLVYIFTYYVPPLP